MFDCVDQQADVVNRGFSGFNSAMALSILPEMRASGDLARTELVVICLGANDAALPDGTQ